MAYQRPPLRLASSMARSIAIIIQVETGRRSASASFLMVSRISVVTHIRNGLLRVFLATDCQSPS